MLKNIDNNQLHCNFALVGSGEKDLDKIQILLSGINSIVRCFAWLLFIF